MAKPKQILHCGHNPNMTAIMIALLLIIALSTIAHTSLALKENSQGNSDVVRVQCINGLEQAAVEANVCSQDDLAKIPAILNIRETQGIKAAKDVCFSQITSPGCRGLCTAVINCFDLTI